MAAVPPAAAVSATFNLAAVHAGALTGCTRAERAAIVGADLVKLKENIVKQKCLQHPFSLVGNVSSFDPAHLKDTNNFFRFVTSWREQVKTMKSFLDGYYLSNVFTIVHMGEVQATDLAGNPMVDGAGNPIMVDQVQGDVDLLQHWSRLTWDDVLESCRIYYQHAEAVDRQNLAWSYEVLMNNCDADMKHFVMSQLENRPTYASSGPVVYYCLAKKLVASTQGVAHSIISGLTAMELRHFPEEDVNEAIFLLRNVLRFLNYGDPQYDQCPPTIMDILYDIFTKCTNGQFRAYIRNLKDFHFRQANTPETLFIRAQHHYHNIITKPGSQWIPKAKKKTIFTASDVQPQVNAVSTDSGQNKMYTVEEVQQMLSQIQANQASTSKKKMPIDRTPPGPGEPKTRVNEITGKEEHWCGTCPNGGRWGNHLDEGHDAWLIKFKAWKEKQKAKKESSQDESSAPAQSPAASSSTTQPQGPSSMKKQATPATTTASTASLAKRAFVSFQDSDDDDESLF